MLCYRSLSSYIRLTLTFFFLKQDSLLLCSSVSYSISLCYTPRILARSLVQQGMRYVVCIGQKIEISGANWLPQQVGFKVCNPVSILGVDASVSELIDIRFSTALKRNKSLVFLSLGAYLKINNFGIVKKMVISRSAQPIICKQLKEYFTNLKRPLTKVIYGRIYGRLVFPTKVLNLL